jgi:GNAT superfamily N-acetyltransferase
MFYKISAVALFLFLGVYAYACENSFKGINQMNKKSGILLANDVFNKPVTLEWEEIQGQTDKLSEEIKSLSHILAPSYAQTEVDFARKKPEDVKNDFMLKSLAPLLDQGINNVDWGIFAEKTEAHLEHFFATMDWKKSSGAQDINIFVTIKDQKTGIDLGVIQFLITPNFADNTVKAALYGVLPLAQNRGLERLLMASIFTLRPEVNRIFLHTRSTNQGAIRSYEDWGFKQFAGKLPNWTDLEYLVEKTEILQKLSQSFILQN